MLGYRAVHPAPATSMAFAKKILFTFEFSNFLKCFLPHLVRLTIVWFLVVQLQYLCVKNQVDGLHW